MKKFRLAPAIGCTADLHDFIIGNMRILPVPSVPEISLYTAHPASRLGKLGNQDINGNDHPPYWAYRWAGGTVLARYILDHPETVAGLRVLDLGAGSGIVGIAAAKAGATTVLCVDVDPHAAIVSRLNAAVNAVNIVPVCKDILDDDPPETDIITVGDLFYDSAIAERVRAYLDRCIAANITIIVGDPGRAYLPRDRLYLLSKYAVPDFGGSASTSAVYHYE
ncbi:class I SAM-dependent methyltransferase [Phyllobacterium sp. K27]